MEALFKKYFWVVNVLVIVPIAYLVASTANEFVADRYFSIPREAAQAKSDSEATKESKPALPGMRPAEGVALHVASDLAARNVFNADGNASAEPEPPKEEAKAAETPTAPQGEVAECTVPISLMGTLVADNPADSLATIQYDGKSKIVWLGSDIKKAPEDETALASVTDIGARRLMLRENGKQVCQVRLWAERKEAGRPPVAGGPMNPHGPGMPTRPGMPERPEGPEVAQTDFAKGVKKISEDKYEIDRSMLDEQLNDLSKLGMDARIVPNYRNGKYEGFKLIGVRPNSMYRAIGIHSGDIIKRINGEEINSPNKAIQLFEKLRSSGNINMDVERRGQVKTFDYSIR